MCGHEVFEVGRVFNNHKRKGLLDKDGLNQVLEVVCKEWSTLRSYSDRYFLEY